CDAAPCSSAALAEAAPDKPRAHPHEHCEEKEHARGVCQGSLVGGPDVGLESEISQELIPLPGHEADGRPAKVAAAALVLATAEELVKPRPGTERDRQHVALPHRDSGFGEVEAEEVVPGVPDRLCWNGGAGEDGVVILRGSSIQRRAHID